MRPGLDGHPGQHLLGQGLARSQVDQAQGVRIAHPGQVLDVIHADFHRNPLAVIERIYGFIDEELTADARAAMQRRVADDPERRYGTHDYDIADFGLTEEEVRERFGDYISRFDLAPGKSATAGAA